MKKYRVEKDTLGTVKVPQDCYFGAQTQRAVENFPISGVRLQECFIRAQAVIKKAAAMANMECGVLDEKIGAALIKAADEVMAGRFKDEFVVDVFQAGAGTSQNMNMNEVLANRAEEILGGKKGEYKCVHPNDHANMSQSTNDTIHAAIHIAAVGETEEKLFPAMQLLEATLDRKTRAFEDVIKCGRTHLQDAVPIELGQVFGAYTSRSSASEALPLVPVLTHRPATEST
jgi:fumarate hydratase class II